MKQTIEIEVPEDKKAVWKDDKIVFEDIKPQLPKTWKEFCKIKNLIDSETYIGSNSKCIGIEKCIRHPSIQFNTPFGYNFWWVEVDTPDELGYVWYHKNHNSWDFSDEFVISESSSSICTKYKTIRAIKRAIRKWKLPIGTTIRCTGKYICETYIFKVTK